MQTISGNAVPSVQTAPWPPLTLGSFPLYAPKKSSPEEVVPMRRLSAHAFALAGLISLTPVLARAQQDLANAPPGRATNQPLDEEYTKKIKEYTTESFFLSPLVDYMPAKAGVPTPKAVLGDIA